MDDSERKQRLNSQKAGVAGIGHTALNRVDGQREY